MTEPDAPWHAHIYFTEADRAAAEALRDDFIRMADAGRDILFVGRMMDAGVGPHPIPQYEIHFHEASVGAIVAMLEASGLRALVHPLTDDDLADHTAHARWIGAPLELDVTTLDPPGHNQGIPRFGITDF
ncbi:MAG TPA: DOPA 4,5-dioxygenase family protein [Allosphingosinicella sp.]|nr:DOPA 4,5-dioxygenase family protein [Allosphingosinicella sp.]